VTVAVLDTGVAYADRGPYRRSPDLGPRAFVRGYDFVDDDAWPNDRNGHGTHVASTIAQRTGNGYGLAGIAYGARIMPVRVLDEYGDGDAADISQGIRFAAKRGVRLINLSFEFGKDEFGNRVTADQIPDILAAIRYAHRKGSLVVAAAGNEADGVVAYPARSGEAFSVGAITEHGCLADYANVGRGLDISAPGGGGDAALSDDPEHCRPFEEPGRDIYQVTFSGPVDRKTGLPDPRRFGIPGGYQGTSMATPHVTAVAALVLASGVLGDRPTIGALEQRLKTTSRDLGETGPDTRYGAGLVDAGAALGVTPPAR
jgi:serine protease